MRFLIFSLLILTATASQAAITMTVSEQQYALRGYKNCVTTEEKRAFVDAKEICLLSVECEQPNEAKVAATQAACQKIERNNLCPSAHDCLIDDTVTEADTKRKSGEYVARETKDACFGPSTTAKKVDAALKTPEGQKIIANTLKAAGTQNQTAAEAPAGAAAARSAPAARARSSK